jgi:hypothetical protein
MGYLVDSHTLLLMVCRSIAPQIHNKFCGWAQANPGLLPSILSKDTRCACAAWLFPSNWNDSCGRRIVLGNRVLVISRYGNLLASVTLIRSDYCKLILVTTGFNTFAVSGQEELICLLSNCSVGWECLDVTDLISESADDFQRANHQIKQTDYRRPLKHKLFAKMVN